DRSERRDVLSRPTRAIPDEYQSITTALVAWTEEHGRSERRRLENRMKSRVVESPADERNIGKGIQIPEDADAIDEDDIRRRPRRVEPIELESFGFAPGFDRREMRWCRFVRRDEKSRRSQRVSRLGERGE